MSPTPAIGEIVHYVSRGSKDGVFAPECRAAVVTEVNDHFTVIGLCAINPTGFFFHSIADGGCLYDPEYTPGSWHTFH